MRFVAVPRVEATYELPDMFVVVYDYVDGVTLDHYVGERDDDNGDGVYGSDVAISLILRDEKGNFVFWRSEYVRKPAKGESRAFSIQIYGLPKYASYEAYALCLVDVSPLEEVHLSCCGELSAFNEVPET